MCVCVCVTQPWRCVCVQQLRTCALSAHDAPQEAILFSLRENMARLSEQGIRLSSMSPSFLSSNSTSHTWPFSAVAELIDNATDPGVSAKQIWIDVVKEGDQLVLTFTDNGNGMTPSKLHKMLSFGFTDKGTGKASQHAIGLYGNGFKSGSMRLGRDTLIFTKNGGCQSVGLLSQTYLQNIKAQAVIVPIVPFNQQTNSLVVTEDSEASLAAILQHSIINSQEQILAHFDSIPGKKGTKILIWNIRRAKDGRTEIDFDSDPTDFRLPVIQIEELKQGLRNSGSLKSEQNVPDMFYSLRAYISILYLKPRTQVILRGKKILAKLVSKSLSHIEHDVYKPQFSKEKVKVTFGLNLRRKEHYGIMMYHKNRLIKAYEKVGCQLKASGQRGGVSVIGVIECNFLKPAHNKQDFEYTKEYRLTLGALGLKLNDYWKEVTEKRTREREFWALEKNDSEIEESSDMDFIWLQCEDCLKWRSIPADHYKVAPETWNCSQNPNPHYRSCSSPEETEESEELLTPSYQKNHKKLEQPKSRKKEKPVEEVWLLEETTTSRSPSESWQPASPTTHRPEHEVSTVQSDEQQQRLKPDEASAHVEAEARTNHEAQTPSVTRSDEHTAERETESEQIKTHEENESRTEDGESSEKKDEGEEKEEQEEQQHMDTLRHKRKPEFLFNYEVKKRWKEQRSVSEGAAEDLHPGKQTSIFKKDSSSLVEKSNPLQQSSTSTTWTYSPLATQTVVVTPLSRTEGTPNRRQLSPDGGDREAKVQKLAFLEREAQRLRSLLGLEVTKTTRGTMTATEDLTEKETTASTTSSDVGCQIVTEECSTSTTDLAAELQSRLKKEKSESPSKTRESDGDTCDDGRLTQQSLHAIRHNVVVLLTALLPQLDLAGISLDTADIDNILQQIIEVNSLKL